MLKRLQPSAHFTEDAWHWRVVWQPAEDAPADAEPETMGSMDLSDDGRSFIQHTWTRDIAPRLAAGERIKAIIAYPTEENWPAQVVQVPDGAKPVCFYRRGRIIVIDRNEDEPLPPPPPSALIVGWAAHSIFEQGVYLFLLADGSAVLSSDRDAVSVFE